MLKWMQVLWPSFAVAAVAEAVLFTVIDPQQFYLFGEAVHYSELATYSVGFLGFWLVCAASSLSTLFLQRSADELNRRD
jgi:H+/Cl- antiporter ClcA